MACSAAGGSSKLQGECLTRLAAVRILWWNGSAGPLGLRPWMRPPFYDRRCEEDCGIIDRLVEC